MHRFFLLFGALAVGLVVACGSGEDTDSDTTATVAADAEASASATAVDSATSTAVATNGGDSAFCSPEQAQAILNGLNFTGANIGDLEAELSATKNALDGWADSAPDELRDAARTAAETMRGMIELLEEHDYDLFAMVAAASSDPRLTAIESPDFQAATEQIAAYCGIDVDAPSLGSGLAGDGPLYDPTIGEGELLEGFPAELVPPDSVVGLTADAGFGQTVEFQSTAAVEAIREFYNEVFGPPSFSDDETTIWTDFDRNSARTVSVSGSDGNVFVVVVTAKSE